VSTATRTPDHIAGAAVKTRRTFVAHRFAKGNIAQMKRADIVPVDEIVEDQRTLSVGGTDLELTYLGRSHRRHGCSCGCRASGSSSRSTGFRSRCSFPEHAGILSADLEDGSKRWLAQTGIGNIPAHGSRLGTKPTSEFSSTTCGSFRE